MIDSHCHLELETYGAELPAVMARARQAGLQAFVAVGASGVTKGADEALALAQNHADVFATVGIHPNEATAATAADIAHIGVLLRHEKVVALGEVGLDYHYEKDSAAQQDALLRAFARMAIAANKPLMLHVREAHQACLALLDAEGLPQAGAVVHCFTGGPQEAEAYLARGMYLSIPGVVTFKNAGPLKEAVAMIPAERMLIETDCPYLAPVPMRGKRNEPAYVAHTAAAIAALRQEPLEMLQANTTANARRLFGLPGA